MEDKYKIIVEQIAVKRGKSAFLREDGCTEIILEMVFEDFEKAEKEFRTIMDKNKNYHYSEETGKGWYLSATLQLDESSDEEIEGSPPIDDYFLKLIENYS